MLESQFRTSEHGNINDKKICWGYCCCNKTKLQANIKFEKLLAALPPLQIQLFLAPILLLLKEVFRVEIAWQYLKTFILFTFGVFLLKFSIYYLKNRQSDNTENLFNKKKSTNETNDYSVQFARK